MSLSKRVKIITMNVANVDENDEIETSVVMFVWNGTLVELEHFLSRSKRVMGTRRLG